MHSVTRRSDPWARAAALPHSRRCGRVFVLSVPITLPTAISPRSARSCKSIRLTPGREFLALAESLSPSPWFYTGGFENHPGWVEQNCVAGIASGAQLPEALRIVRDPSRVAALLRRRREYPFPRCAAIRGGLPARRKLAGETAALGRRPRHPAALRTPTPGHVSFAPACYFQERIVGPSFSALLHRRARPATRLVGVTQQLLGLAGSSVRLSRKHRPLADRGVAGRQAAQARRRSRFGVRPPRLVSASTTCSVTANPGP